MIRPSWTATTFAFEALIRSTSCSGGSVCGRLLAPRAAAEAGAGAGELPGSCDALTELAGASAFDAPDDSPVAVAFAVALDRVGSSAPQPTCLPVTGRRASISPVSVATTERG